MDERIIYAAVGAFVGAAAGVGGTYLFMQKAYEKEFNKELEAAVNAEVAATKKFYNTLQKSEYPTPGDLAAEKLEAEATVDMLTTEYRSDEGAPTDEDLVPVARNVFTNMANVSTWDADAEEAQRTPGVPYVLSEEEFFTNEGDRIQSQLVYFEGDDVLTDTDDRPVGEEVVGPDNLLKFGHGSKDPNIVYVRNERLDIELEIMRVEGKFSEQVHGFIKHNDDVHRSARTRKFRLEDE